MVTEIVNILKIKEVLLNSRKYVLAANHKAEARHDNIEGDYMDGAQYEIMVETKNLLNEIDSISTKLEGFETVKLYFN